MRTRDPWIGWSEVQRRRRLPLVVNHCRCLLLPHKTFPSLGSRALRLTLERLSADWQERYGHPVVLVETFVDPEKFSGTVYTANGWQELGTTDGFGRVRRDFYVQHQKPTPDIFLEAARGINVDPKFCRAYEVTDLGMQDIRAAGMEAVDVRELLVKR